jgi:hypothetical protein
MSSLTENKGVLLKRVFAMMESRSLPFVVIHSYHDLPSWVESDVDLATTGSGLAEFGRLILEGQKEGIWRIMQYWRHETCAIGCLLTDPDTPRSTLLIDMCSDYVAKQRVIMTASELLDGRTPLRGFHIPRPEAEAVYLFAKGIVKRKEFSKIEPQLELLSKNSTNIWKSIGNLIGDLTPSPDAQHISDVFRPELMCNLGRPYNLYGQLLELQRKASRLLNPEGLHLHIVCQNSERGRIFCIKLDERIGRYFLKTVVIEAEKGQRIQNLILYLRNIVHVHLVMSISPSYCLSSIAKINAWSVIKLDNALSESELLDQMEQKTAQFLEYRGILKCRSIDESGFASA